MHLGPAKTGACHFTDFHSLLLSKSRKMANQHCCFVIQGPTQRCPYCKWHDRNCPGNTSLQHVSFIRFRTKRNNHNHNNRVFAAYTLAATLTTQLQHTTTSLPLNTFHLSPAHQFSCLLNTELEPFRQIIETGSQVLTRVSLPKGSCARCSIRNPPGFESSHQQKPSALMLMHACSCSVVSECEDGKGHILLEDFWHHLKFGTPHGPAQLANKSMFKDEILLTCEGRMAKVTCNLPLRRRFKIFSMMQDAC